MPSSIRSIYLCTAVIVIVLGAAGGTLALYGTQSGLPHGFTVSGWRVGGMPYDTFQQQFDQQLKLLSAYKVVLQSSDPSIPSRELTLGQLGLLSNGKELDALLQGMFHAPLNKRIETRWKLRQADFALKVSIDAAKLAQTAQQSWKDLYAQKPIPAKRIVNPDDTIRYEPEQTVTRIDVATLRKEIVRQLPSIGALQADSAPLTIPLPVYQEKSEITVDSLQKQGIERRIGEFTTTFPASGSGRIHNIRSTASTIQDMLLKPGDTFDYSKVIEQTEGTFGYQEAPVILNGKLVPGVGGGICQVSTTLYNAVLRSGLEIVERRNHSLPVSYVPLGQDATFASGYINFKFRNNTDAYLLIRTETTDQAVTVKLFGRTSPSVTYDVESKVVEVLTPPVKYVHNPTLRRGSIKPISAGKSGYVVETYRIKKQDGVPVSRERISKDRYAPVPTLVASNRGEPAPEGSGDAEPGKPIVEDGVKGPTFR